MKLYATVTSERATKGQGGNDFLDVFLTVERDAISAGHVYIQSEGDGYKVYYTPPAGMRVQDGILLSEITREYITNKRKGEKQ